MDIKKIKLLLVEGKDEVVFFKVLCEKLGIDNIQIIESGGKDKFKDLLPAILNIRGFEKVTSIGIIRDADESSNAAFDSIKHHLLKNNLIAPNSIGEVKSKEREISIGVFIMPGNRDIGMLENLMLDTVVDHPVKISSDKYIDELKEKLTSVPQDFHEMNTKLAYKHF